MNALEQLRQWAEEEKKDSDGLGTWDSGYYSAMVDLIDRINELQSVKPDGVESYLDKSFAYTVHFDKDGKSCIENEAYESIEAVTYDNALAALQALAADKDAEVKEWHDIAHNEMQLVQNLTAEVERLKGWISVEDRLPQLPPPYEKDGVILTPVVDACLVYDGENVYQDSFTEDGFNNHHITHWKPLPEPPKQ